MTHHKEARTIDEVIDQLEQLIHECSNTKDRIGYFASLYHKVTVRVKDAILKKEFEDNARMEKFDVIFANRYLSALRQWKENDIPTAPWLVAFNNSKKNSRLLLQHLLLGMNAHINLDLGIAAVQVIGTQDIRSIHNDFNRINDILGAMTFEVLQDVNRISPLLSLFGLHATNDTILIQFSITNARDGAWSFAEDLSTKKGQEFDACILTRSNTIRKLADSLVRPAGLVKITLGIIHLFEWRNPRKIIQVLHEHRKTYLSFRD
ncbi:MAG TPA: DUF5995 family protein [Ohtaekwangia sp.]|uniref:DUF5995 family protein n=1 Tax=Ohtaekwangia sp. TaxID=2066019 RepID=UPI002F9390ED